MDHPTIPLFQKRLLVVEDNIDVRRTLVRILEIEGYHVRQASDGRAALEILKLETPELILSDIFMPNLDGIELYGALRKNPRWATIPFIFLTTDDSPEGIRRGRELGVEDYLVKPVDAQELVKTVNARLLRSAEVKIAFIDQAYLETVTVLANTIEGRDHYTRGHVERVTMFARLLAEALNWPEANLRILEFGARLHDIGKITIPDRILNKPDALTADEWAVMKLHTLSGVKILNEISHLKACEPYVLHHHERWDGSGYPYGLQGREISLEGRLLAVADVYDALTTHRPYHPARPHHEVVKFLQLRAGKQFDPDLTPIFIDVVEKQTKL